jgi:hypothetical protein
MTAAGTSVPSRPSRPSRVTRGTGLTAVRLLRLLPLLAVLLAVNVTPQPDEPQKIPVGRHRPGRLRLLRADYDGLPRRRDHHARTSQQWASGPQVPASQVQPGDLVFFAGSDGTLSAPGHVGIVTGKGMMIDALYTGVNVREESYTTIPNLAGFTRP